MDLASYAAMAVMAWHEWLPGAVLLWMDTEAGGEWLSCGCNKKKALKP
ncbi:hypothetical protein [Comamonas aquatica]|nr:hypothetical protein [Comamonas aquatica]